MLYDLTALSPDTVYLLKLFPRLQLKWPSMQRKSVPRESYIWCQLATALLCGQYFVGTNISHGHVFSIFTQHPEASQLLKAVQARPNSFPRENKGISRKEHKTAICTCQDTFYILRHYPYKYIDIVQVNANILFSHSVSPFFPYQFLINYCVESAVNSRLHSYSVSQHLLVFNFYLTQVMLSYISPEQRDNLQIHII